MDLFFFWQFVGYKCDPHGEYVRRWLPELARLPTEWIHHPWNAPESVLEAAGIELGSNYPLPIIEIDSAKVRLEQALSQMWQNDAAARAAIENGMEEGHGDSADSPIAFPQAMHMEMDHEPVRNNPVIVTVRRYEDQMVPSMTSSLFRAEDEENSVDIRNSVVESRAEVPTDINVAEGPRRDTRDQAVMQTARTNATPHFNFAVGRRNSEDSTAESSSSTRERDGGVVPTWSPSSTNYSDQYVGDDNGIGTSSSYLQRHPQSHQLMNWQRLSQTG